MPNWNTQQRHARVVKWMTSVWLRKNEESQYRLFYCFNCTTPVFQYSGEVVQMIPGESPAETGVVIQCKNPDCGAKFKIHTQIPDYY